MTTVYINDAIFWIELEKISPNPYQPRREFDPVALKSLSESIRMYGVLQPLVVTRKEVFREDGGMQVEYELISGERRLRASKLAGLSQVPALIRNAPEDAQLKLEMAIIENLQREDLNPVDRARSFDRLAKEFNLKQAQIAAKIGKSREYVSNSMRILLLPDEMITSLEEGKISEGHTRPLLMLADRPDEQLVLFKEIMSKKLTVREAESLSRRVATDRIRNKGKYLDPVMIEMEKNFTESLGTRVRIEKTGDGGTVTIDFFSPDDLRGLLEKMSVSKSEIRNTKSETSTKSDASLRSALPVPTAPSEFLVSQVSLAHVAPQKHSTPSVSETPSATQAPMANQRSSATQEPMNNSLQSEPSAPMASQPPLDDRAPVEIKKEENEDLYSLKNFSL
ncbi:MAG: chromosome partitioning protein ParB, chromosome partitioning protein ParB family [Candidatus Parcubacteria bacterium]|jgi:ParB family chromosome partitioning protein